MRTLGYYLLLLPLNGADPQSPADDFSHDSSGQFVLGGGGAEAFGIDGLAQGDELVLVAVRAVAERGLGAEVVVALHVLADLEAALQHLLLGGAVNVLKVARGNLGGVRGDGVVEPVRDGSGQRRVGVFADEQIFPRLSWGARPCELGESFLAHAGGLPLQCRACRSAVGRFHEEGGLGVVDKGGTFGEELLIPSAEVDEQLAHGILDCVCESHCVGGGVFVEVGSEWWTGVEK